MLLQAAEAPPTTVPTTLPPPPPGPGSRTALLGVGTPPLALRLPSWNHGLGKGGPESSFKYHHLLPLSSESSPISQMGN